MITSFVPELEEVFGWLVAASWQASLLAVFVLLIQRILGSKLNPRWRHTLWLLVLLRLVLPVQPESALSLFQFVPKPPTALEVSVTEPLFVSALSLPAPSIPLEVTEPSRPFSFYSLLAVIWLAGAMALLLLTWMVNRRFARQVADSPEITDPELLRLLAEAKAELGVRRAIRLIENGRVQSPAIMGLFTPTLLLPDEVREKFDARELRFIFLHELAHLKRGDVMVQALIALLQILHWFNPVLWYAFRRMRIDREPATDALVLSRTGEDEKERYGLMLIKLLEHFNQRHSLPTLVGILEDKDQFKRRFSLIARFTRGAYGWSVPGMVILGVLSVAGLTKTKATEMAGPSKPLAQRDLEVMSTGSAASTEVGAQGKRPGDHIKIRLIVAEIKKDVYLANKEKVEMAVKSADIGYLNNLTGVNVLSAPSVETDPGEKATVEITRELPFPLSFEKDKDGKFTPTDFDTRDCGIKADLTPTEQKGKIELSGNLTLTDFEGFTFNGDSDTRVGSPTFSTTQSYIFEEFEKENQFKGMLIPGIQHESRALASLQAGSTNPPAGAEGSDTRLIVFLSAGRVQ